MTPDDLARLKEIHATKHLRLTTGVGLSGQVDFNGNPVVVVTELLALAEKGFRYEQADKGWNEAIEALDERDKTIDAIRAAIIEHDTKHTDAEKA